MIDTSIEDHDMFQLFGEYSGFPTGHVHDMVQFYRGLNEHHWAECSGDTWEEKAREFYSIADGYVFDLINANRSKHWLVQVWERFGHWDWIRNSGPEVLEFGGGLGLACSVFRDLGRSVTYVDVEGPVSRFARWYFERTGQRDIEVTLTPVEKLVLPPERQWDFVYSDSVIEHVIDPGATVDTLARAVRPGGLLYLIIDAHSVEEGFPMHRHVHLGELLDSSNTLRAMEHIHHDGDGYNVFRAPAHEPSPNAGSTSTVG